MLCVLYALRISVLFFFCFAFWNVWLGRWPSHLSSIPPLWPILIIYVIWMLFDNGPEYGGRANKFCRTSWLFKNFADYYPIRWVTIEVTLILYAQRKSSGSSRCLWLYFPVCEALMLALHRKRTCPPIDLTCLDIIRMVGCSLISTPLTVQLTSYQALLECRLHSVIESLSCLTLSIRGALATFASEGVENRYVSDSSPT